MKKSFSLHVWEPASVKCLGDSSNTNLMLTFCTCVQREWMAETRQFISRLKKSHFNRYLTVKKKRTGLIFLQHVL